MKPNIFVLLLFDADWFIPDHVTYSIHFQLDLTRSTSVFSASGITQTIKL